MTNRVQAAWLRLPGNARGALWITMGTVFFAVGDTFVKSVGVGIHPVEMALFRYVIGFILLSPLFLRVGAATLKTDRLRLHFLRAVAAGTGQAMAYYAVIHLMLADATAISFSRPLFVTLLAVFMLGEAVRWRRWTATAVGFVGVLIMVRPGQESFDNASLVAVVTAIIFAFALILIRRLSTTEPPIRILFYYHIFGVLIFLPPSLFLWRTPTPEELLYLFLIAAMTTVAMAFFVRALSVGEASIVGPMEYTRIVYAAILGYYFFFEIPDLWTLAGAVIIIASTVYIARHEAFARRGAAGR